MKIEELENIIKSEDANTSILYANRYELENILDALEDITTEVKRQIRNFDRQAR